MTALSIQVRGVVQGVGFRPFVFRLARAHSLHGWVANQPDGVDIHLEGSASGMEAFLGKLSQEPPSAARISSVDVSSCEAVGLLEFTIRKTEAVTQPVTHISPDLPVCADCLAEMRDPANARCGYPYINCTNCGPRYTVIQGLPYDRGVTTMSQWPMDDLCRGQYFDPEDRRFHAQPIACPACGPGYSLDGIAADCIPRAAQLLRSGHIVAIKGIGGYHLACDARNAAAVEALRERKFRKEKPFAVMMASVEEVAALVELSADSEALLTSTARPIVLATARVELHGVAPGNAELGVMLPYAPLHHLLFDAGAPTALVVTSANRSSEPIAYRDEDAYTRLSDIADAFLVGERQIARRVDDSVARVSPFGPVILRRSRGYTPGAAAVIPSRVPILAVGADLKNAITLVVDGHAFVSQHIGDLDHYPAFEAHKETIRDLTGMYNIDAGELVFAHDAHPQYVSAMHALECHGARHIPVQHHRAHIASVLAERQCWDAPVIGISFDGTGFGDDGAIWGGEFFHGSVSAGFARVTHLRPAMLPGGDAAAHYPVQCAAGFLDVREDLPDLRTKPFCFPQRYEQARQLIRTGTRTFPTTSAGRLFDTAAALIGFTRETAFEGQAAIWLEQLAQRAELSGAYPFPCISSELDYVPLLQAVVADRLRGRDPREIARAFHRSIAQGIHDAATRLCETYSTELVVLSGGVFQNNLLLHDLKQLFTGSYLHVWTNSAVPPNDGGISLGQAAIAAFEQKGAHNA